MANVGNVHGTASMDPSNYTAGLRQMAQETYRFQQSIQSGSYGISSMGGSAARTAAHMNTLNRSVYASMTAFYMLTRQISGAMNAYEEYDNVVARIGSTADMSTSSVLGLSEALKGLNRQLAGSRTDMMRGMYRAVQAGFTSPSEFVPIAESAMRLRTASGREINTTKSADAISVIRNALGVKSGREGFITDMLLRGRDVGRFELNEMTAALGIPLTIYGNQFSSKIGAEETLRQVVTMLAATTKAGLAPNRAATGIRRMVEKTILLGQKQGGIGKNLHNAMQGLGYTDVFQALDEGPMPFMKNLLKVTGGTSEGLIGMGYGAREMMALAAALSGNMRLTDPIYQKLGSREIAGTTDKYLRQQQESWWNQRDRLRSAYLDTQLSIMQAMLPTMKSFATTLETVNDLFQALSPAVRNLLGLLAIGSAGQLMKNFFFRPQDGFGGKGGFKAIAGGATGGYYSGRSANLGLTYNKDVRRIMNPSALGNRAPGPNYRYRGPSGFVKPAEYASFDPSAYVPKTPPVSAFRRNAGNAWRFMTGGQAVREGMIGSFYNNRIEGRQAAFDTARQAQEARALGVYNKAVAGGMPHERAAAMSGNALADSIKKMDSAMKSANATTRFWAGTMSKLSGIMGTLNSLGGMIAMAGLFQLISDAINGLNYSRGPEMVGGRVDYSRGGRRMNNLALDPRNAWANLRYIVGGGFSHLGEWIEERSGQPNNPAEGAIGLLEAEAERKGYMLDEDMMEPKRSKLTDAKWKRDLLMLSTMGMYNPLSQKLYDAWTFQQRATRAKEQQDVLDEVLRAQFSPGEQTSLRKAGYGTFNSEFRTKFVEWLKKPENSTWGGTSILEPGFGQKSFNGVIGTKIQGDALRTFMKEALDASESLKELSESVTLAAKFMREYGIGVNVDFMTELRNLAAPNLATAKKFWTDAKDKGVYSTEAEYQKQLRQQFREGGFLPDDYFGNNLTSPQLFKAFPNSYDYLKKGGGYKMLPPDIAAIRPHGMKNDEGLYDFLSRIEDTGMTGLFQAFGGRMQQGDQKDKNWNFQQLKGAAALFEAGPNLTKMNAEEMDSLVRKIAGEDATKNKGFTDAMTGLLQRFDISDYIKLVDTGEYNMRPVQKYSDALAYGSSSGYNATLPYWAEKGDEKQEMRYMWDQLMKKIGELITAAQGTKEATEASAANNYDYATSDVP